MYKETKFDRDDLRSGYVVEFRNGHYRLVMRAGQFTKVLVSNRGYWNYLQSNWGDDLKFKGIQYAGSSGQADAPKNDADWDIVRVYGLVKSVAEYSGVLCAAPTGRQVLWERKEAEKLTLKEVCRRLGYEVEIVVGNKE